MSSGCNRRSGLLLRAGQPVPLTPKAFETRVALVECRDRVVEKAELMRRLWPDHVVEEANLTQQIFTLRKALGDDPEGSLFIEPIFDPLRSEPRFQDLLRRIAVPD